MEKIIFDTNFILTAIKQKIDFISDLEGYELLVPKQVLEELKKITTDKKKKLVERELAGISLAILNQNKSKFRIIELEKSFVDTGLLRLNPQEKPVIATLDREIKRLLKGKFKFLTITKRKKLEIVG
jgi:rRNA-processing protein FCF1